MILITLSAVLLLAAPQQAEPTQKPSELIPQQRIAQAREKYELSRQAAIKVNGLAGGIHSEADARAFVDAVAVQFTGREHQSWTTRGIRHRVAHAEYEAVSDSSRRIPEQRIVDVWNEYVRELDAPEETVITVAELHNLRDAMSTSSQSLWKKGFAQSLWTIPNVYAVDADGKIADGCRAVEALKILHDLYYSFQSLRFARERVQNGVLVSDLVRQGRQNEFPRPQKAQARLVAFTSVNPVQPSESSYIQAHGQRDYRHLLQRLFTELFPAE